MDRLNITLACTLEQLAAVAWDIQACNNAPVMTFDEPALHAFHVWGLFSVPRDRVFTTHSDDERFWEPME